MYKKLKLILSTSIILTALIVPSSTCNHYAYAADSTYSNSYSSNKNFSEVDMSKLTISNKGDISKNNTFKGMSFKDGSTLDGAKKFDKNSCEKNIDKNLYKTKAFSAISENVNTENVNPNNAYMIEFDKVYTGNINAEKEQRWYAVKVDKPGKLSFILQTVNNKDINYNLMAFSLDMKNNTLNNIGGSIYGATMNEQLSSVVSPGYYFFCVISEKGFDQNNPYAFTLKYSDVYDEGEPDDNILNCKERKLPLEVNQTIDNDFDIDWLMVTLDSKQIVNLNFENVPNSIQYKLDIFNANLGALGTFDQNKKSTFILEKGTYFLRVRSENGFDKNAKYKLSMSTPNLLAKGENNQYVLQQISNKQVAVNGVNVDLNWKREFQLNPPGGGYTYRSQDISVTDKTQIMGAGFGTYKSPYTGEIKHAFSLKIKYVLYTYWYTQYFNGGPSVHDQTDVTDKSTPRTTDDSDPSINLIIDADTGKVVDFYSELNFYYGRGIEKPEANIK